MACAISILHSSVCEEIGYIYVYRNNVFCFKQDHTVAYFGTPEAGVEDNKSIKCRSVGVTSEVIKLFIRVSAALLKSSTDSTAPKLIVPFKWIKDYTRNRVAHNRERKGEASPEWLWIGVTAHFSQPAAAIEGGDINRGMLTPAGVTSSPPS